MIAYAVASLDFVAARYRPDELVLAGPGRRLIAAVLDYSIAAVPAVLFFSAILFSIVSPGAGATFAWVSFAVMAGGFVWFIVAASHGQSPGKQLTRMYVLGGDGTRAGFWYVIMRELVVKQWLTTVIGIITLGIYPAISALWCLWDPNRQCLWDKIVSTYVAYSPMGFVPASSQELRSQGLPMPGPSSGGPPQPAQNIVIHNNAQVGSNWGANVASHVDGPGERRSTGGRVSLLENGRETASIVVSVGEVALIGREASARLHVSDASASRRHAEVMFDGTTWTVRELGSLNPTQVIEASGRRRDVRGQDRMPYGQLAIGESIVTLYPAQADRLNAGRS